MPRSTQHRVVILVFFVIAVFVLMACVWFFFFRSNDPAVNYRPKYSTPSSNGSTSTSGAGTADKRNSPGSNQSTMSVTSEQVPTSNTGIITIIDLEQTNGFVNANASVSNFETTQCVYSFTADGARPVIRQVDNSCTGVSIPQGEFEIIGKYTLTVTAYHGTTDKIIATKDINIR